MYGNLPPTNKRKVINDPVYGFITIPDDLIFDVMEHPFMQRLRRIKQLGLTYYVYPSAHHTRFQHALGSMHLAGLAIAVLRSKGVEITEEEAVGVRLAILMHDIGHGPFSHTLEQSIVTDLTHEDLSKLFIGSLDKLFDRKLDVACRIFSGTYPKRFLHQLVSSQLDMDRLDYLSRDSFFTGVNEGVISTDRIINTLTVCNDELVVEGKGIYSIEKFIIARRLMYWQVYLHRAVLSADMMLVNTLRRAKFLGEKGEPLFATPTFEKFLRNRVLREDFLRDEGWLDDFSRLDDFDIVASLKVWVDHPDPILSTLSGFLSNRRLFRAEMQNEPFDPAYIMMIKEQTARKYHLTGAETDYFVQMEKVENKAYNPKHDKIKILMGKDSLFDISEASEQLNIAVLPTTVSKYVLCHPKDVNIL
ncbi:MAG: HD domain-containing protein [bacterium]